MPHPSINARSSPSRDTVASNCSRVTGFLEVAEQPIDRLVWPISNNLPDRLRPLHSNQPLIQPAIEIAQPIRIDSTLLQNRRVQVLDMEARCHRGRAQLSGFSHADS